ncbi:MAG: ribonuclease HI family protein [Candidatus Omnitrophota bacterium]|jgi:ribonuclease HI
MKHLDIFIDGASKGNPGPSGVGVVICHQGQVVKNISSNIGVATNNTAEYTALIYALEEALILKADSLTINTDSQLLARQLERVYKVRHENIKNLYLRATRLISAFKKVAINNIPREENSGADKLADLGAKKK